MTSSPLIERLWPQFPVPLTRLIGRDPDVAALLTLMHQPTTRFLTLIGPGGVGKSRLAQHVTTLVEQDFPDGSCFVSLAPVSDPADVPMAIIRRLGVPELGSEPPIKRLRAALAGRKLLLVLDNLEHLAAAATDVTDLLAGCPELFVLVTSRVRLDASGERLFIVKPLAFPEVSSRPTIANPTEYGAIELFIERMRATAPDVRLTKATVAAVTTICQRLDGLPLAIELAAAWTNVLSPLALIPHLEPRLPMLNHGQRDMPDRMHTMRKAIGWSYDLLSENEQAAFRQLCVFAGGFTLEAAECVIRDVARTVAERAVDAGALRAHPTQSSARAATVLDLVASLVDQSMVIRAESDGNQARFDMLETIREFGRERLDEQDEADSAKRAHASWCVRLAKQAGADLDVGLNQHVWFKRLDLEYQNLLAALAWLTDAPETEPMLQLVAALERFWYGRNHVTDGRAWLERAWNLNPEAPPALRVKALTALSMLSMLQDDLLVAARRLAEGTALAQEIGDDRCLAHTAVISAYLALCRGEFGQAIERGEECLARFQALGDAFWMNGARQVVARATFHQGQLSRARKLYEQVVHAARSMDDRYGLALSLQGLALVAQAQADHGPALRFYAEALAAAHALGETMILAQCLEGVASAAAALGHFRRAVLLFGAASTVQTKIAVSWLLADAVSERVLPALRDELGESSFAAAWDEGANNGLSNIVSGAMELAALDAEVITDPAVPRPFAVLTKREIEVMRLVIAGQSDKEIAAVLGIAVRTASNHVAHILEKLDVSTRAAAVAFSLSDGFA